MTMKERAAMFLSFRALSGYEEKTDEAARYVEARPVLDESALELLDAKIIALRAHKADRPEIELTRFIPDKRKSGGRLETLSGRLFDIDDRRGVILSDETAVPFCDIMDISCPSLFPQV